MKRNILIAFIIGLLTGSLVWWYALPDPLFEVPYSTVLEDRDGGLLSAQIASDGQWRFAPSGRALSSRFERCVVQFEDKRFYRHAGVDLRALVRAIRDNVRQGRVVSGASTISMQVIRLSRRGQPRSIKEKVIELFLATRLEMRYSKAEILRLWSDHAPFGGNVVGIDAATWRYWGRSPDELSWAEAATLAVLPNAPSLIHPGRDREVLLTKRDRLLTSLLEDGHIDSLTYELALMEPLPQRPKPLPQSAPHLLTLANKQGKASQRCLTTISAALQSTLHTIVHRHHDYLAANHIHNAAAMITDVETGEVLAYVGNVDVDKDHAPDVDILQAPRSSGSILKPFLYAMRMQRGEMLPKTLVPDIPMQYDGFRPSNFSGTHSGAVSADVALAASLNLPAVHQLRSSGIHAFRQWLRDVGFHSIHHPADHYGLSLILGGAEVTAWEVSDAYRRMSYAAQQPYRSDRSEVRMPPIHYLAEASGEASTRIDPSAAYLTMNALRYVQRPASEAGWQHLSSTQPWAWKTGTSIGHRDAWAVATHPRYTVVVWCGNADGEGRPQLTGIKAAAPLLFDILGHLSPSGWYVAPHDGLRSVDVCTASGMKAGPHCPSESMLVHKHGLRTLPCAFHEMIYTDDTKAHRVHRGCETAPSTHLQFVLPATMAHYYRQLHPSYVGPLPWRADCQQVEQAPMDFVYPEPGAALHLPIDRGGERRAAIFEAVHADPDMALHWWLNDTYLGRSSGDHTMKLQPPPGSHEVAVVDANGHQLQRRFEVVE